MECRQRRLWQLPAHQLSDKNMDEIKTENFEGGASTSPVEGAAPVQASASAPAPMPTSSMPSVEQPQVNYTAAPAPEVERMQMPIQPIDLSAQPNISIQPSGMTMQMEVPATGGGTKKVMIIGGVVVAGLIVGAIAFFVWKSGQQPVVPVAEQTAPVQATPVTTTTGIIPQTPQLDDISVIESDLNAFNVGGIDAEAQANLNEIDKSL